MNSKRSKIVADAFKPMIVRKLRFDSLEERRLLAGLNVFVFQDADASQWWETSREQGIADRVVFLDSNQNGLVDAGEPWVKTDDSGRAAFKNLSPGAYYPTLLANHSLIQTTHVGVAPSGSLVDVEHRSRVIGWQSETRAWLIRDGQFELFDWASATTVRSYPLQGTVVDASVIEGLGRAALIVQDGSQARSLLVLELESGATSKLGTASDGVPSQVFRVGQQFFVAFKSSNNYALKRIEASLGAPSLASVQNAPTFTNAKFAGSENGSTLVVEQVKLTGSQFQFWTVDRTKIVNVRQRFITGSVEDWKIAPDGVQFAASIQNNGMRMFRLSTSAVQQTGTVSDAAGPLGFDAARSQWIVGTRGIQNELVSYRSKDGSFAYRIEASLGGLNPFSMAGLEIATNPFSTNLFAFGGDGTYVHNIAVAMPFRVDLTSNQDRKRVDLGQRILSGNFDPTLQSFQLKGLEDVPLPVTRQKLGDHSEDKDDDGLHYFMVSPPSHGTIAWSPSKGGVYVPEQDYFGQDSFIVQAYDGRGWSSPKAIQIELEPVNDSPASIDVPPISIGEHVVPGQEIGVITVVDPDPGSVYEITVDDPRIFVVGNILKIAADAKFDFESETSFLLEISAQSVKEPSDYITRTITITVEDENDAPTGFDLSKQTVLENVSGAVIGVLEVQDPDASDQFSWIVSDGRFTVENNVLKLAEGRSLNFESQSKIDLLLTVVDKGNERYSKQVTIDVEDRDDLPVAIHLEKTMVVERVRAYRIGTITVQDEDAGETFNFTFSDDRFTVVDGILRLKSGVFVSHASEQQIPLTITATSTSSSASISRSVVLQVLPNANPFQNNGLPVDVDGDGRVTPRDVLRIINELNSRGIRVLTGAPDYDDGVPASDWFDVNGDGSISPLDAVIVINYLNRNGIGSGGNGGTGEGRGGDGGGEGEGNNNPPPANGRTQPSSSSIQGSDIYNRSLEAYLSELQREELKKRTR